MNAQYAAHAAHAGAHGTASTAPGDDQDPEMQTMWQFLDSSLTHAPTTGPPPVPLQPAPVAVGPPAHPRAATVADPSVEPALNEDENGMYNELGDVFSMFFNLDSDEAAPANNAPNAPAIAPVPAPSMMAPPQPPVAATSAAAYASAPPATNGATNNQKVQLARTLSGGSTSGSPGGLLSGYPSMSPATMNWLHSLATSASCESLTGLISPATLTGTGTTPVFGVGSAGPPEMTGSAGGSGSASGIPRTPSCEMIDWKAYNDACGMAEKAQKEPAKWRVIPQHGPHADPTTAANAPANHGGVAAGYARPPPASAPGMTGAVTPNGVAQAANEGVLRKFLPRHLQTITSTVASIVGAALSSPNAQLGQVDQSSAQAQSQSQTQSAPPSISPLLMNGSEHLVPQQLPEHQPQLQQFQQPSSTDFAQKLSMDEKNKRKAIISPEYVQYGSSNGNSSEVFPPAAMTAGNANVNAALHYGDDVPIKLEDTTHGQFATRVPDPTGRRPAKKTLHQTAQADKSYVDHVVAGVEMPAHMPSPIHSLPISPTNSIASTIGSKDDGVIRCKCTGKCRNARCACVKAGLVCGIQCKCVSCANPFVPMAREGIDIQKMSQDVCLMQFLSKIKDMQELLESYVAYDCCKSGAKVQVKQTVENGWTCPDCKAAFTYSWCSNKLCHDQKKPRKHCAKCRRCGDHRNEHCDLCNHCYFAGVANSFSCSCTSNKPGNSIIGTSSKSRAVVPNPALFDDHSSPSQQSKIKDTTSDADNKSSAPSTPDDNTKPTTSSKSSGASTISAGLSNSEPEKDDACPVQ
ncbi:TPA: hypothetical protein N0F65_007142 [Lagenidium giganteum]|uniref:Tesmin/TSO1-like CXC domain-containing protein n=1 Tax=Lagenidium giganteum TaxID=4803 RepID=A0AAV2YWG3_9STRA|nr:TPA: hypothetical protein N0F65_007142 [Lagenidium giganteum]